MLDLINTRWIRGTRIRGSVAHLRHLTSLGHLCTLTLIGRHQALNTTFVYPLRISPSYTVYSGSPRFICRLGFGAEVLATIMDPSTWIHPTTSRLLTKWRLVRFLRGGTKTWSWDPRSSMVLLQVSEPVVELPTYITATTLYSYVHFDLFFCFN